MYVSVCAYIPIYLHVFWLTLNPVTLPATVNTQTRPSLNSTRPCLFACRRAEWDNETEEWSLAPLADFTPDIDIYIHICIYTYSPIYLSIYLCVYLSIHRSIYILIARSIDLYLSSCLSVYLSVCVYIHIHLSSCVYIYIYRVNSGMKIRRLFACRRAEWDNETEEWSLAPLAEMLEKESQLKRPVSHPSFKRPTCNFAKQVLYIYAYIYMRCSRKSRS